MKLSIKLKLILTSILMILLVIGIMAGVFLMRERRLVRDNIVNKARVQVNRLGSTVANAWYSSDRDLTFLDLMNTYGKIPYMIYVFVADASTDKPNIIASTGGKGLNISRPKLIEEYWNNFPNELRDKQKKHANTDEPLVLDWNKGGLSMLDFSLSIFHPIRKDERMAIIQMGMSTEEIDEETRRATITVAIIASILIVLGLVLGFGLGWYFSTPIQKLASHALKLGTGDFSLRIELNRSDELGELAKSFNSMAESLEEGEKIKLDKARIDEQIDLAREIQEGLNPSQFYQKEGLEIKGFTKAAKGIGGDYFDFIDIDDERVAVLVSDVSGKDIPASLIMIMIRTVLNTLIKSGSSTSPDMIVKAVNQIMSSDFAIDKFATMLFLIINRKTGDLHFSNAGHAPVLIYRSDINKCSQLSVEGLPIGVDEDSEYVMGHTKLNTGDVTILYSDGVTEAWNPAKEEYQKGRVIRNLINFNALDAKTINEKIIADVWEFMQDAAQHDDTTLVVVKKT